MSGSKPTYSSACCRTTLNGTCGSNWTTVLFEDHDKESAEASRKSIVAPAPRSEAAKRKDLTKRTESDEPVHSFRSLLADLGTLCKNRVRLLSDPSAEFYLLTRPTPPQQHALSLARGEVQM